MGINYLDKLNDTFIELLTDLTTVFPHDTDLRIYLMATEAALEINPWLLHNVCKNNMLAYEDHILSRNEDFFIQFNATSNDNIQKIITKLKTLWGQLGTTDKDVVWRYFKTMILIYRRIDKSMYNES